MSSKIYNVLFICTGNSARSIMAESLLNGIGHGRFIAYSAGSHASGQINPYALEIIKNNNLPTDNLRSKNWDEFSQPGAPELDFVFTVCDKAAGEVCPIWPGQPMTAHWGVEEPSVVIGNEMEKKKAFSEVFRVLHRRISFLTCLPIDKLDALTLKRELDTIGRDKGTGT
ncbi:MAG: arsenate reductase ArsC [Sheuella sp.]|nr:arsenate reductase ArsC [Sheuella sp.]